ncbi:MAG: hypothetical protein IKE74_05380 [Mogibacterium sp.]|nr:hypothetical protein [Mogibacterium sp.]
MKNLKWCIYTYRHRKAFEYCVRRYIHEPVLREEMLMRAAVHDMDKMTMYLFMDQKEAQEMHVDTQPHHLENDLPRTYEDLVETVIDYECAPYTKPDKPLNAFDFTNLLMDRKILDEETGNRLISIMEELGIAGSTTYGDDEEGQKYISSLEDVTEEMIYEEILTYINEHPDNALNMILEHVRDSDSGSGHRQR